MSQNIKWGCYKASLTGRAVIIPEKICVGVYIADCRVTPGSGAGAGIHSLRRATREPTGMPISAPIGPHFTDIR